MTPEALRADLETFRGEVIDQAVIAVLARRITALVAEARREPVGLLRLIAESAESAGIVRDEYVPVPTQYVVEAARIAALRAQEPTP